MTSSPADPSVIDSRHAAIRLLVSLGLVVLGNSSMYVVSVVLPAVQAEFGISRADASMPYTLMMVCFGLGGILCIVDVLNRIFENVLEIHPIGRFDLVRSS